MRDKGNTLGSVLGIRLFPFSERPEGMIQRGKALIASPISRLSRPSARLIPPTIAS